jgi:hypothetical protein
MLYSCARTFLEQNTPTQIKQIPRKRRCSQGRWSHATRRTACAVFKNVAWNFDSRGKLKYAKVSRDCVPHSTIIDRPMLRLPRNARTLLTTAYGPTILRESSRARRPQQQPLLDAGSFGARIVNLLSLWAAWSEHSTRFWVIAALANHFIMRTRSSPISFLRPHSSKKRMGFLLNRFRAHGDGLGSVDGGSYSICSPQRFAPSRALAPKLIDAAHLKIPRGDLCTYRQTTPLGQDATLRF